MTFVVAALALAMIAFVLFLSLPPRTLAMGIKQGGPWALIGVGALLLVLKRPALGGMLMATGFALRRRMSQPGSKTTASQPGRRSSVRTAAIEMELDHVTGAMEGIVLAGHYEGRELRDLDREDLLHLHEEIKDATDSLALLEAYLDRRFAGWREDTEADSSSGQAGSSSPGAMSEQEAYEVLGLAPGADLAAIRAAHRRLMKEVHPDRGGSTFLSAKINEAKDVLVRSHS